MQHHKTWPREILEALLVALVFAVFARTWVVQAFKIPTGSMEENLLVGDHILVNKFIYGPVESPLERVLLPVRRIERGDIVVFKFPEDPERDFIKRCVGLPGDEVELKEKVLHLNGRPLAEPYTFHKDEHLYPNSPFLGDRFRARDNFGPYVVPPGSYFCLGDNRDNSHDSRFWGPVPRELIKGRALMVYWSLDPDGRNRQPVADDPWWRRAGDDFAEAVAGTRWERTFRLVR